jgi:multisubunit Na+/H+ antiporter MnhB subunit
MKTFLILAVVLFFAVTIVMAVVFRNEHARNRLRFVRNVGWAYVIAIVALAAWSVYEHGF